MFLVNSWRKIALLGILLSLLAAILFPFNNKVYYQGFLSALRKVYSQAYARTASIRHLSSSNATMGRTPVYFFSHGGPNLMEDVDHPAYAKLQSIGREITQKVKPKAVVVFSAHWQGEPNVVDVNTAETLPLVYDYYGFPPHYYEVQYPNKGSPQLASRIITMLAEKGIKADGVRRGLDHGVFSPFLVAFDPEKNPLNCPVVQVSLFDSDSGSKHYELGAALSSLRDEGVLIIVSGMAVHNLRDFMMARMRSIGTSYTETFDTALKEAVETAPEERRAAMDALLERKDARKAHPSFEHLLPIHIGAGAAGGDKGKRLWTLCEGSMSWAQFRFGEVESAA
jgi:4,5-DOPA dioxygenase extradiol